MKVKIDLHLHSKISKRNDIVHWDSDYHSISRLKNEGIKIAAFSDHYNFSVEFYLKIKKLAATAGILILPAIEINVLNSNQKKADIIFIFSEQLTKEQLEEIEKISNTIPKKGIALLECNNIFNQFETIKIPHVGKSDYFKYEDLLKIEYDAIEISNKNHNNFKSVIKQKDFKKSIVAFSDTHDWKKYPQARTLITEIDQMEEISFKELKKCLQKNRDYTINRS